MSAQSATKPAISPSQSSSIVVQPGEGESYWQPLPSRGYATIAICPDNNHHDTFSAGRQVLPPGCSIREHGHKRNHELLMVQSGSGTCTIDGVTHELGPGSIVLFGRYAVHTVLNTGDTDLTVFWVFMPPGLEDWYRAIGKPRSAGQEMPAPFARPDDVAEVQRQQRFVVPVAG
jgi:mannose-6-phosphate isomerase-like protein (cupin superfamily)